MYKKVPGDAQQLIVDPVKVRAKFLLAKAKQYESEGKMDESAATWRALFKLCPEMELNQDYEGDYLG